MSDVTIEQGLGRVVGRLHAENAALRAELAAHRSEDIGPWRCLGEYYALDVEDGAYPAVELHADGVRWIPRVNHDVEGRQCSGEPAGLLTAMRSAAESALAFGWSGDAAIPDTRLAGHDDAVAAERAAVVAWLRSHGGDRITGTWAAARIDAGEHVAKGGEG